MILAVLVILVAFSFIALVYVRNIKEAEKEGITNHDYIENNEEEKSDE